MTQISVSKIPKALERVDRVLLIGPPGIGKTWSIAYYAATEARRKRKKLIDLTGDSIISANNGNNIIVPRNQSELVEIYRVVEKRPEEYYVYLRIVATHLTPEDLQYPRVFGNAVVSMMPVKLAFLALPVEGILFIDEITNVQRDDALTAFFAIVNEKTVGLSGQLSSDVKIVAAGNSPEDSAVARELPAPLINRFIVYQVRPPTADEFIEWYERFCQGCHEAVPAYLAANPDKVYVKPKETETLTNFPTPRTWTRLGRILDNIINDDELLAATAVGLLGPEVGGEFAAFVRVRPPSPEELIENPLLFAKLTLEQQLMAAVSIARYYADNYEKSNIDDKMERLVNTMFDENGDAAILSLRIILAKSKEKRGLARRVIMLARRIGLEKIVTLKNMINEIENQLSG